MTILAFQIGAVGQIGTGTRLNTLTTNDSFDTVTSTGYLNGLINMGIAIQPSDMFLITYGTSSDTTGFFEVDFESDGVTLLPNTDDIVTLPVVDGDFTVFDGTLGIMKDAGYSPSNAAKTKVVMANGTVTANHIATFADTAGTIKQDSTTAINAGNIQAGLSGTEGHFISYPPTAAKGSLSLTAIDSAGDYAAIISNASLGQATTWTIPDPAAATSNILASGSSFTSGHWLKTSGTAGLMVDSGFSVPAADASANANATTIAVPVSSNGSGVLSFSNTLNRYAAGTLTLSQIQNAFTTPIELIPAPGAGFMIYINHFVLELIYGSAAYSGGGAAYLQYGSTAHGTNYATPIAGIPAAFFTGLAANSIISASGQINSTSGLAISATSNAAITYTNATAVFTSGTGGSANWYLLYSIVPIT